MRVSQPISTRFVRLWHRFFGHPDDQRVARNRSNYAGHRWICECGSLYWELAKC